MMSAAVADPGGAEIKLISEVKVGGRMVKRWVNVGADTDPFYHSG